ncbi:Oxidoreductase NAD-binding domain/Flavodoxin [Thauera sp. 28]|nr:Oxidoreductase NAD-binding domain/Flavodoxin [Thauera sp. 28]
MIALELPRLGAAAGVLAAYAVLCLQSWRQYRRLAGRTVTASAADGVLIAYASQSGFAAELADEAVQALGSAGAQATLLALDQIDKRLLESFSSALFIVSTCGEGDAPDNAARFADTLMRETARDETAELPLDLRYGLLALGDRSYNHYCGFGRRLDAWLESRGARRIFPRIEVDRANTEALRAWRHQLAAFVGIAELDALQLPATRPWRIRRSTLLNPGSVGAAVHHVELEALADDASAEAPNWEAGDLLQLYPADGDAYPRDYSIASLPEDGAVHLLVRRVIGADSKPGVMSSRLTAPDAVGTMVRGRIRSHQNFRIGDNSSRPLLLIGNGTGLAGLLAHLRQRARNGDGRNWLVFGERNAACDDFHGSELDDLQGRDLLARCDRVFSRDLPAREYVQDRLLRAADTVREWVSGGAAIYVCGNAVGMGPAVDEALRTILGAETIAQLALEGRYRRDIY